MSIDIIPAIDLLGGHAVRLMEGRREQATVYATDPVALIEKWAGVGANRVHVVDLDGAFSGDAVQADLAKQIAERSSVPVQVGGGLRTRAAIDACLEAGAASAVVGTAAVKNPDAVSAACRDYPGRIIVAVDARNGIVTTEGWTESAELTALELGKRAEEWGAAAVLYTDVSRDGTEVGPNVEATAELADALSIDVIASGGVGTLDHIRRLSATSATSVIVGRALYENRFTLPDAMKAGE